ncbi:MAG: hypothetical protein LUI02_04110, partial [Clostridiales bacterium]|nr:hypothetical protein [Clostridiales bacterium]
MKLTVIWLPTDDGVKNKKTLASLARESKHLSHGLEIITYASGQDQGECEAALSGCDFIWLERTGRSDVECYNDAMGRVGGDCVTAVSGGDFFEPGAFGEIEKAFADGEPIIMPGKMMPTEKIGAFADPTELTKSVRTSLSKDFRHYPFYLDGTFLSAERFKARKFDPSLGLDAERDYFLRLCMDAGHVMFCPKAIYVSEEMHEQDSDLFRDAYEREWYMDSFEKFWFPFLEELVKRRGGIPYFIQYHLMFTVKNRIYINWNNRNKHVITEEEGEQVFADFGRAFLYIDDAVLFNAHRIAECNVNDSLKWIYGILKFGPDFRFEKYYLSGRPYYGAENTLFNGIDSLRTNIQFCNYEDGTLSIDGTVHPLLFSMAEKISLRFCGKDYPLEYNERYSHYKVFGISIYKRHPFHADFPMEKVRDARITCIARVGGEDITIPFSYESHFSRISGEY